MQRKKPLFFLSYLNPNNEKKYKFSDFESVYKIKSINHLDSILDDLTKYKNYDKLISNTKHFLEFCENPKGNNFKALEAHMIFFNNIA